MVDTKTPTSAAKESMQAWQGWARGRWSTAPWRVGLIGLLWQKGTDPLLLARAVGFLGSGANLHPYRFDHPNLGGEVF